MIKADAYGHGLVPAAHAFLGAGAAMLCVATVDEVLVLRAAGITAPHPAPLPAADRGRRGAGGAGGDDPGLGGGGGPRAGRPTAVAASARVGAAPVRDPPGGGDRAHPDGGAARAMRPGGFRVGRCPRGGRRGALVAPRLLRTTPRSPRRQVAELARAEASAPRRGRRGAGPTPGRQRRSAGRDGALPGAGAAWSGALRSRPGRPARAPGSSRAAAALRPAMSIHARPIRLLEVRAGTAVSYGGRWVAPPAVAHHDPADRATATATRAGTGPGAEVLVCGRRAPIVGSIAMDALMVDVTDIPERRTRCGRGPAGLPGSRSDRCAGTGATPHHGDVGGAHRDGAADSPGVPCPGRRTRVGGPARILVGVGRPCCPSRAALGLRSHRGAASHGGGWRDGRRPVARTVRDGTRPDGVVGDGRMT